MGFQEPNKKWFKDLKRSRKDFNDVDNIIEAAKFKYEKENHVIEWVLGIATALFFSLNVYNAMKEALKSWMKITLFVGSIFFLVLIVVIIFIYIKFLNRQKTAMSWLYREKDKQENLIKSKK